MRLRNVKGSREAIVASEFTINDPENQKGNWNKVFGNDKPIHIEVGMGKGRFITDLAKANPDINYIGIEKYSSVLIRALEKRQEVELDNLLFIRMDAEDICDVFAPEEVHKIYLNFSDPWPKDRHARRRLTSSEFLARYDQFLAKNGRLEFKTDNVGLFDFSLEEINNSDIWHIDVHTYDLHEDPMLNFGNVMTEYEEKFSSKGNPICKLIASR